MIDSVLNFLHKEDSSMEVITLVYGSDWSGVYRGNTLLVEGHDIDIRDLMESIGYDVRYGNIDDDDLDNMLNLTGRLPKDLRELEGGL